MITEDSSGPQLSATADISGEPYFPITGDQMSQGSCAAWANVYYAYGYLEARDNGWTGANSGNTDHRLSPSWVYNKITPFDGGSMPVENAEFLLDWGASTWTNMPYSDSTVDTWGNESSWRDAPYHRPLTYTIILLFKIIIADRKMPPAQMHSGHAQCTTYPY